MAKKNKISELERMQMTRIRLQAESKLCLSALDGHVDYLQEHFGSLLMGTVTTAVKSKLPTRIQSFIPSFTDDRNNVIGRNQGVTSSKTEGFVDQVLDILPLVFKGFKPMIGVFVLKKVKEMIFRKKKKNKV